MSKKSYKPKNTNMSFVDSGACLFINVNLENRRRKNGCSWYKIYQIYQIGKCKLLIIQQNECKKSSL